MNFPFCIRYKFRDFFVNLFGTRQTLLLHRHTYSNLSTWTKIVIHLLSHNICGRAEIGRQARLRGVWVSRESSSLSDRTKNMQYFFIPIIVVIIFMLILMMTWLDIIKIWAQKRTQKIYDFEMEFFHKHKKIILIVLIVLFIELSGYGILASLSRLLSAL